MGARQNAIFFWKNMLLLIGTFPRIKSKKKKCFQSKMMGAKTPCFSGKYATYNRNT